MIKRWIGLLGLGAVMLMVLACCGSKPTDGKTTLTVTSELNDAANKLYYVTGVDPSKLTAVTYGTAVSVDSWTKLESNSLQFAPTGGHTVIRVVEVDASNKPVAVGDAKLNIG